MKHVYENSLTEGERRDYAARITAARYEQRITQRSIVEYLNRGTPKIKRAQPHISMAEHGVYKTATFYLQILDTIDAIVVERKQAQRKQRYTTAPIAIPA